MIRGLYTSALGMTSQMKKMDVISNNIANVNTAGFKKDTVVTRSFTEELMRRLDDPGDRDHSVKVGNVSQGVFVDDVYTSFESGSLQNSGGALDLAISGAGFFAVSVMNRDGTATEKYTRDGAFTLTVSGTLVSKDGNPVIGENGPLTIPAPQGIITIDERGQVFSNDEYVDTVKMVDFEDTHTLRKIGDNYYSTTENSVEKPVTGTVVQGYLENSNVNSVREMVDMINISRVYEANQRMIVTIDTTLQRSANDLGRK